MNMIHVFHNQFFFLSLYFCYDDVYFIHNNNIVLIYLSVIYVCMVIVKKTVPSMAPSNMEALLLNSSAVYLKWKPPPIESHHGK